MMKKHLTILLCLFTATFCQAKTGRLFTVTSSGSEITITPVLNRTYQKMGILITNNQTVTGCRQNSNGYCIFSASKNSPKTLTVSGSASNIQGNVCLNGLAQYSCQKIAQGASGPTTTCTGANPICRVFVTSTQTAGNFGGLAGGDTICQGLATTAGFSGNWAAWLSDSGTNAPTNIGYTPLITYVRAADTAVTIASPGGLLTPPLDNAILLDENGTPQHGSPGRETWTGTDENGVALASTCSDWASNVGFGFWGAATETNALWTNSDTAFCGEMYRIYCFEVPS